MRIVVSIIVLSILLTGCLGVDGEPIVFEDGNEVYANGFLDGCMSSLLLLTSPQNLPPYDEAIVVCEEVRKAAGSGAIGDMPSETNTSVSDPTQEPVVCDVNCI